MSAKTSMTGPAGRAQDFASPIRRHVTHAKSSRSSEADVAAILGRRFGHVLSRAPYSISLPHIASAGEGPGNHVPDSVSTGRQDSMRTLLA